MSKKLISLCFSLLLVFSLASSAFAHDSGTTGLSDLQIREKFDEINSRYEVGEAFSEEDANFVREQAANLASKPSPRWGGFHFTYSGSLGNVKGSGFVKGETFVAGGKYEGNIGVQTPDLSKKDELGVIANVTVYGAVGSDGVGKIFDRDYTKSEKNSNYVSLDFADGWSGVQILSVYTFRGLVNGNSFLMDEE